MKKISVIIPMYNTEHYIRQCIQSAINQTYRNLEILVIDDGSVDRSLEICREISMTENRLRLCCQDNGGVSKARNHGLEIATGEYVFFLDSDDAIHPLCLEELVRQMEEKKLGLAFCDYARMDSRQMELNMKKVSWEDERLQWETAEDQKAEEWFHCIYPYEMSSIGGKMVRRDLIGDLRFDENLINGEDTLFVYQLVCRKIRAGFFPGRWYWYRIRLGSMTQSSVMVRGKGYFECSRMLRDKEYAKGHVDYAVKWEEILIQQIKRKFLVLRSLKEKEECKILKKVAVSEKNHPLFKHVQYSERLFLITCIYCYPMYHILCILLPAYWKLRERMKRENENIHR